MRLIIVEDEIRIREGLVRLIGKLNAGYEIAGEAENGKAGYELAIKVQPDIIITDIKMPVMDGLEMLTALYENGMQSKAIVLSAYSEFEYARQAMRIGVKEYLLKPIVIADISEALHRVENEIQQEKVKSKAVFRSVEQIFAGILWGGLDADGQMKEKLSVHYAIPPDTAYTGICVYLGNRYETSRHEVQNEIKHLFSQRKQVKYILLEAERERALLALLYEEQDIQNLEHWVQYWLLQDKGRKFKGAVGFIPQMKLEEIKTGLDILLSYMDWNITLGDDVMISYPKITKIQTRPCIYPLETENQMKIAVCTGQEDKISWSIRKFYDYFHGDFVFHPKEIKECYVRFLWALINTGKEVGIIDYEGLEQQKLLEQIMGARTSEELWEIVSFLKEKLHHEEEEVTHLTIKRAQGLIQEFYQTGITLEEIAAKLNITPEYLGTRFHREMGVTFSAYMKNYRITRAKELLIGTSLKQYEIAEKVGYADAKYFSRVFKEATGQLPADYRKTHK